MRKLLTLSCLALAMAANAEYPIEYEGELGVNAGSGDFAPYFITSNSYGVTTAPVGVRLRAKAWRPMTLDKRFNYGFGADIIGGYASATDYDKFSYSTNTWSKNPMRPPYAWIQQLYAEVKWRGVFLTVGLKEYDNSGIVDQRLSSGDLTFSGNTRPIPGFRAGFVDFQNVPFTKGWLQVQGELGYGKSTDNAWTRQHFNFYDGVITQGWWYNYKRFYFRTNPGQPFSVTVGMQAASQFAGDYSRYLAGKRTLYVSRKADIGAFFKALIPQWGETFLIGNHVGSWDFKGRVRLRNGDEISGYFEWPWEDGSGIGKLNGFDGLWGIEYKRPGGGIVSGAVIEYLDFTNQSGPIHWNPNDYPGTSVTSQATGFDNYYNNNTYNGYALYGLSIGTPFIPSTLYNLNGNNEYACNRVRGFHIGVTGEPTKDIDYRLLLSYRKGWGQWAKPFLHPKEDTSLLLEWGYKLPKVKGLKIKAQVAFDAGKLYGDNFGAFITCSYQGTLRFGKKK